MGGEESAFWPLFAVARLVLPRLLAVALLVGPLGAAPRQDGFLALVFSKTAGFRHDSIPDGIQAIKALGREHGFQVEATEDATQFSSENLARFRVVVFLNTTLDVLDPAQQTAFESFIRAGGGFVGVHAAADTEYDWPFYGQLVGAYFKSHPRIQSAVSRVVDHNHASTSGLPSEWTRTDEWYNYREDPSAKVQVLIKLDESTYSGGSMDGNHPIAWRHERLGGRAWYTGMGHTKESYSEPLYLEHLLGGILWAAHASP